jgi:hypothetical protein
MGCLGVHFALDEETVRRLKGFGEEQARLQYLQEELEDDYFDSHEEWFAETYKSWDAIHRSLTDGELGWDNGSYPLNHVILGGELLYTQDDYIMSLKTPAQVRDVAEALKGITEERFKAAYFRIDPDSYCFPVSEEDFEYTWSWFEKLVVFFGRAAAAGRYVLFTASQ